MAALKTHLDFLDAIAQEDVAQLREKEAAYGSSWKMRGGVGAYFSMIRKVDRLEQMAKRYGYDIFKALDDNSTGESLTDTIGDLRRYLDLIEAEHRARKQRVNNDNSDDGVIDDTVQVREG